MHQRYFPPTRTSIWPTGQVKSLGPHHFLKRSGSVHACHTRSRGASNTRVMTRSFDAVPAGVAVVLFGSLPVLLLAASMLLLLRLHFPQVVVQAIEPGFPMPAVTFHPIGHVAEGLGLEPAGSPLGIAAPGDQPGPLEHLEVLRDGGETHRERLRQLGDRGLAPGEARQNRAPRGVG